MKLLDLLGKYINIINNKLNVRGYIGGQLYENFSSDIRPGKHIELEEFEKKIPRELNKEWKGYILSIAEYDYDVACKMLNSDYYVYSSRDIEIIKKATKINKARLLEIMDMRGVYDKLMKRPVKFRTEVILGMVSLSEDDYELAKDVLNFCDYCDVLYVLKIAKVDVDAAKYLCESGIKISSWNTVKYYLKALQKNKRLTYELVSMNKKWKSFSAVEVYYIVDATEKAPSFMNDIYVQVQNNKLNFRDYVDISYCIYAFGEDFVGKKLDELTKWQKKKLLKKISYSKYLKTRTKVTYDMFPCLPRMDSGKSVIELIDTLMEDLDEKPEKKSDKQIKEFIVAIEGLFQGVDEVKIRDIVSIYFGFGGDLLDAVFLGKIVHNINAVVDKKDFCSLSDSDKIIVVFSLLIMGIFGGGKQMDEVAYEGYRMSLEFGIDEYDARKIYTIIKLSGIVGELINPKKFNIDHLFDRTNDISRERYLTNYVAFALKEGNVFELAQLVYSSKNGGIFEENVDKILSSRIAEMKADDFVLYQTPSCEYERKGKMINFKKDDKSYNIRVVKSGDIDNFYALGHCVGGASFFRGDLPVSIQVAKLMSMGMIDDDRVYSCFYIDDNSVGVFDSLDRHTGGNGVAFIFSVPNDKMYVASGHDIGSTSKTIKDLLIEYFILNGMRSNISRMPDETKGEERAMVSRNLKTILGVDDREYVKILDELKSKLRGSSLTPDSLLAFSPELKTAYDEFYSETNTDQKHGNIALLNNGGEWNEVLVSNARVVAICTLDLSRLSHEMLRFAQKNNLPVVVLIGNKK